MQNWNSAEYRRFLKRAMLILGFGSLAAEADTTNTDATLTNVVSFDGLAVGMKISGAGIPAGTTIIALDTVANEIEMSANATASAAGVALTTSFPAGATIHTYSAAPSPGPTPVPGDFTESAWTGYVALTASDVAGPFTDDDGNAVFEVQSLDWVLTTAPAVGEDVLGYWVQYTDPVDGAVVMCWENFSAVQPMRAAGDAIVFALPIQIPARGTVDLVS